MSSIDLLMPHSGNMVLVDEILEYGVDYAVLKSVVKENNAFLQDGFLPNYVLAEMMAQTLVVLRGLGNQENANTIGFLLALRNFEVFKNNSKIGDEIILKVKVSTQDNNGLGIYECQASIGSEIIAKASITALNPNKEYLEEILQRA